jgi:hypothetical protein
MPLLEYLDWQVDDPAGRDRETVRQIVDEIDLRVRDLLRELGVEVPARDHGQDVDEGGGAPRRDVGR